MEIPQADRPVRRILAIIVHRAAIRGEEQGAGPTAGPFLGFGHVKVAVRLFRVCWVCVCRKYGVSVVSDFEKWVG